MRIIETDGIFGKSYTYTYTLLVGDKEYQYNKLIGNAGVGSIVDVELSSKGIQKVGTGKKAEIVGTVIQAMDTKRIKIQGEIHKLKPRFYIYYINKSGEISKVLTLSKNSTILLYAFSCSSLKIFSFKNLPK